MRKYHGILFILFNTFFLQNFIEGVDEELKITDEEPRYVWDVNKLIGPTQLQKAQHFVSMHKFKLFSIFALSGITYGIYHLLISIDNNIADMKLSLDQSITDIAFLQNKITFLENLNELLLSRLIQNGSIPPEMTDFLQKCLALP